MSVTPVSAPDPTPSGELHVLRKQTAAYIKAVPTDVVFQRRTATPDGAGGHTTTRTPLAEAQTVRMIQASEATVVERRNTDGENVRPTLNLLSRWDADIMVGDTFDWKGHLCEVVYITDLQYELISEVAVR